MRIRYVVLLGASLVALVAAAPAPAAPTPASNVDRAFVAAASASNATEIAFAKEAIENGDSATRAFAHTMLRDHTKLGARLAQVAGPLGLKIVKTPSIKDAKLIAKTVKLKGAAFDRAYRAEQVTAHKATLVTFQTELAHGKAPALKKVAAAAIPTIKMHLSMAERLVLSSAKP
jgi:putative membrane protein